MNSTVLALKRWAIIFRPERDFALQYQALANPAAGRSAIGFRPGRNFAR